MTSRGDRLTGRAPALRRHPAPAEGASPVRSMFEIRRISWTSLNSGSAACKACRRDRADRLQRLEAALRSVAWVQIQQVADPHVGSLNPCAPAKPAKIEKPPQTHHPEAGGTPEGDGPARTSSTVEDVIQQHDRFGSIEGSLYQAPPPVGLSVLAHEAAAKGRQTRRRESGAHHRIGPEAETGDLMHTLRTEALGEDSTYFLEHAALQHRYARVQKPANGLAAGVGDELLLATHERLLVQAATQVDQVGVRRRTEGASVHEVAGFALDAQPVL